METEHQLAGYFNGPSEVQCEPGAREATDDEGKTDPRDILLQHTEATHVQSSGS